MGTGATSKMNSNMTGGQGVKATPTTFLESVTVKDTTAAKLVSRRTTVIDATLGFKTGNLKPREGEMEE